MILLLCEVSSFALPAEYFGLRLHYVGGIIYKINLKLFNMDKKLNRLKSSELPKPDQLSIISSHNEIRAEEDQLISRSYVIKDAASPCPVYKLLDTCQNKAAMSYCFYVSYRVLDLIGVGQRFSAAQARVTKTLCVA